MKHLVLISALAFGLTLVGCGSAPSKPAVEQRDGCHTPLGFIPEGKTAKGYLHQVVRRGESCQSGVLTCENGVWAGAFIYPTCVMTP